MDPGTAMLISSGVSMLGNLLFGGNKGLGNQPIEQQPVDPELQQRYMKLLDYFINNMGQQATPLPGNMPISANWHPNITDASNIYRSMAGMGGLSSWQGAGGTPFQYGTQASPTNPWQGGGDANMRYDPTASMGRYSVDPNALKGPGRRYTPV